MKKFIAGFIIGGILFSSITILAYTSTARDIVYRPSNSSWKVNNVGDAIDYLKTKHDFNFGTPVYQTSYGTWKNRSVSLNLKKGKYLLVVTNNCAYGSGEGMTSDTNSGITINCDSSKCSYRDITKHRDRIGATAAYSGTYHMTLVSDWTVYYLELSADDTISYSHTSSIPGQQMLPESIVMTASEITGNIVE